MTTDYYGPARPPVIEVIRTEATEFAFDNQAAGQALNAYQVVYRDGGFWKPADANLSATIPRIVTIGMAQDAPASGQLVDVWFRGLLSNATFGLRSNAPVYLASGGGLTMSAPTASGDWVVQLGRGITSTLLDFSPQIPIQNG